jgi:hypothetical protein
MGAQVQTISLSESNEAMIILDAWHPEYQRSESSGVGGICSSPLSLLKRTALVATVVAVGTIPVPVEAADLLYNGIEATFVFPSASEVPEEDEYSRIRREIVASGLPMLNDDEVRVEIMERKGIRGQ